MNTAEGWDAVDRTNGLGFIMMHEVMHMTDSAKSYDQLRWGTHLAFGGTASNYDATSPNFVLNEQFVNYAAREVSRSFPAGSNAEFPERLSPDGDTRKHVPVHGY